jgi:hypothetical protein
MVRLLHKYACRARIEIPRCRWLQGRKFYIRHKDTGQTIAVTLSDGKLSKSVLTALKLINLQYLIPGGSAIVDFDKGYSTEDFSDELESNSYQNPLLVFGDSAGEPCVGCRDKGSTHEPCRVSTHHAPIETVAKCSCPWLLHVAEQQALPLLLD